VSRSLRRGAVAAVILATAPILAACSAGSSAATLQVKPDSAATSIVKGDSALKLNGIVVVTDAAGNAPANVSVNIANNGSADDTLTAVTVDGGSQATLSGAATIPAGGSLLLSGPDQVSATVPTLNEKPGQNAVITFTFANAGSVTVQALVNAGTGQYASYAPVAPTTAPAVTVSPSAAAGASAKASSKASSKASVGASASASKTP
jgi:copper(I)-binding protein